MLITLVCNIHDPIFMVDPKIMEIQKLIFMQIQKLWQIMWVFIAYGFYFYVDPKSSLEYINSVNNRHKT
jgi:hypothetical protein